MAAVASISGLPSTSSAAFPPGNKSTPKPNSSSVKLQTPQISWFGTNFRLQSSNPGPQSPNRRAASSTVVFNFPTKSLEEKLTSTGKPIKWSLNATKAFAFCQAQAKILNLKVTTPEFLILGILIAGTNLATRYLLANGVTVRMVREEIIKLRGKTHSFQYSNLKVPPLSEDVQQTIDKIVDLKIKSGEEGKLTTADLLLGFWYDVESPGHKILAAVGFTDEKANELKSLKSEFGFIEE